MIVFELGDGLLGTYGVESILRRARHQGGADRGGAVRQRSGRRLGRRQAAARALRHRAAVVTGPATDNQVGVEIIREQLGVEAFNAISNPGRARRPPDRAAAAAERRRLPGGGRVSERVPAMVLGGTGYVAGELLRLIAAHPRLELEGVLSDSQPGGSVAGAFPHLGERLPAPHLRGPRADRGARSATPREARCSRRRPTASPPPSSTGCSARPQIGGRAHALRRHLGGLPLSDAPPPTRRCTSTRMGRPSASRSSPARCRSTSQPSRRRTSRIPAASPPHRCSRACRCSRWSLPSPGCSSPASPAAPARGASRSTARTTRCVMAISTATAPSPTGMRRRSPPARSGPRGGGPRSISCRTPAPSRAASTSPCRRVLKKPLSSREAQAALAQFYRDCPFVRVLESPPRVKDVATSNYAHLSAVDRRLLDRGHVGARQSQQGCRRRRDAVDEPAARLRRRPRPQAPRRPAGPDTMTRRGSPPGPRPDHLAQVFAQYPIEVVRGEGVWLHARDGRKIPRFLRRPCGGGLGLRAPALGGGARPSGTPDDLSDQRPAHGDSRARRGASGQVRGPRPRHACSSSTRAPRRTRMR